MNFETLWNSLPDGDELPCQDMAGGVIAYKNQCAIRMSIALNKEKTYPVNKKTYSDPKCSHEHARGAQSLADWLWKTYKAPFKYGPKEAIKKMKGHNGIVFIKDCYRRDGDAQNSGDHIDLWCSKKEEMKNQPNSLIEAGTEVWFFTI